MRTNNHHDDRIAALQGQVNWAEWQIIAALQGQVNWAEWQIICLLKTLPYRSALALEHLFKGSDDASESAWNGCPAYERAQFERLVNELRKAEERLRRATVAKRSLALR